MKKKGFFGNAYHKFKELDLYGAEFGLNYNGHEQFKTVHGALFSILVLIIVLYHTISKFIIMVTRSSPETFAHDTPMLPGELEEFKDIGLGHWRFNVAIQMRRNGKLIKGLPKDIGTIEAYQIGSSKTPLKDGKKLKTKQCELKDFKHASKEIFEEYQMDEATCVVPSHHFAIRGKPRTKEYKEIIYIMKKCEKKCQSPKKMNSFFNQLTVGIIGQRNVVNFKEYEEGKVLTSDFQMIWLQHLHFVDKGRKYGITQMLMPSEFEDESSRFHIVGMKKEKHEFLSLGKVLLSEPGSDLPASTVFTFQLTSSFKKKSYERVVMSVLDWLSGVGGLLDVIERLIAPTVLFFSVRMFNIHMNRSRFYKRKTVTDDNQETIDDSQEHYNTNCCRILAFQYCLSPFVCCCKHKIHESKIWAEGEFYERGVEKMEASMDVEQLRKDHRLLLDLKFLMLDDPYLRKLLKIQRWRRVIELQEPKSGESGSEQMSEVSSGDEVTKKECVARLRKDQGRLEELYKEGETNMKSSILARLVDGISERYALRRDIGKLQAKTE